MRFRFLLCFLLLCTGVRFCYAQEARYTTHSEFGLLTYGPFFQEASFTGQSFHGVAFANRYRAGVQVGVDNYNVEGSENYWLLPVSARFQTDVPLRAGNAFFVGINGGYGLAALHNDKTEGQVHTSYRGGFVFEPFAGFKFKINARHFWSVAMGYKDQAFEIRKLTESGTVENLYTQKVTDKYHLQRFVVKFGWGF